MNEVAETLGTEPPEPLGLLEPEPLGGVELLPHAAMARAAPAAIDIQAAFLLTLSKRTTSLMVAAHPGMAEARPGWRAPLRMTH